MSYYNLIGNLWEADGEKKGLFALPPSKEKWLICFLIYLGFF
jgi:hypothetical protein